MKIHALRGFGVRLQNASTSQIFLTKTNILFTCDTRQALITFDDGHSKNYTTLNLLNGGISYFLLHEPLMGKK